MHKRPDHVLEPSLIDVAAIGAAKTIRRSIIGARQRLPFPPDDLLEGASLLLDLDGTLLDLVDRPDEVRADVELVDLLDKALASLNGRVAVVSGRSLEQIDAILGEAAAELTISGSHGCEHRCRTTLVRPNRPGELDEAAARIRQFADGRRDVLLEEKSFGVALHYRTNPDIESEARAVAEAVASDLGLYLQTGKMMVEVRAAGGDKGRAVHRLMEQPPMRGTRPVFIGDDVTDEPGFTAARELGGHGILIGPPQPTAADYRIDSPGGLRRWLAEVLR